MNPVLFIAGHGAGDSGAVGNGYTEAALVRMLASRIGEMCGDAVRVLDMSRNWYADNGIGRLDAPKGTQIVELHMDAGPASAKGGHVIINGRYSADAYDEALASFVAGFFPGRARSIVGRTDLANANRAAARGYGYRLMECGFITNAGDVDRFTARMDELAAGILAAFGIETKGDGMATPAEVWGYTYGDSGNCFNALHEASREILRTDDPTGRGVHMTTHEHVKWIAAKQADMAECLERIEAMLAAQAENKAE